MQIEGRHPVIEAFKAGRQIEKVLVAQGSKGKVIDEIYRLAKDEGTIVQQVNKAKLDSLSQTRNHQGVIATVAAAQYQTLEDIIALSKKGVQPPLVLLLDQVTDPHNLGAILRTADATGVHGVIIPKRRAAGLSPLVAKASAGAIEHVAVARVSNLAQTVDLLKDAGFWIVAADSESQHVYFERDLTGPLAVIIGSEGKGISRLLLEKSDYLVRIPMLGQVASLNASVATGILLYEIVRQRQIQS